ncbi:hypothetical protein N0V94_002654 [Neodidymelliopsis sp. IMI 364377]|nr:hypothetical protein N0V94_002654 [Neodidymelliopsis sp. IMI 364377]
MRLLYTTSNGKLRWTEDLIGDKIPPYAILSHTWKEGQEVTFNDLRNLDNVEDNDAKNKEGYGKIRFCAQQAQKDGLDYFWVDTCCIDKSNSSELQEAINSMFHWYQNAKKCYVYLSDVEKNALDDDDDDDESAFKKSRWFARGWTLQELLAPASVEFFSKEGARLGDKESLKHIVQKITGIPIDALSGKHVSEFSKNALKRLRKEIQESGEDDASAPVNDTGTRCRSRKETLAKICQWLSAPDPSTNYHKAHKQRQAETGLWLLQSASFTAWKENAGSRLWLYGIPGCGKTILSSTIIETLLQHCHDDINMVTVYFYFDFNDPQKQNPELLLHSLFYQLLQHSLIMPKGVDALFSSCGNGQRQPSMHALLEVMLQVIQQFTHVYIVLDALDECTQRSELMDVLATIAKWELQNLHLLMTSRRERDIESSLGDYLGEDDAICLQSDVVDKDIQQYVQQRLSSDKSLEKWKKDESVREEIEATLMREAHGIEEDSEYALRILQWLTFSARPLSPEEIAEAVAVDVTRDSAFDRDDVLEDPLESLDICSSLVTLTMDDETGRRIIALAHYSVQEYLVSDRIRLGQAKAYSMQEAVCQHAITQGPDIDAKNNKYGDALHTASFHGQEQVVRVLLDKGANVNAQSEFYGSALQAASSKGYTQIVKTLLDRGANVNAEGGYCGFALQAASNKGHEHVVELLLERGAEVNAEGGRYGHALQAAALGDHKQVVKILLDRGADANVMGEHYSALQTASRNGYEQVVKILLDRGANIDVDYEGYSVLEAAGEGGNVQIVKMILDRGADVNAQGGNQYGNALQAASQGGHKDAVRLLLHRGADINMQGGHYGTALQAASQEGHEQVVKLLLNRGADVNAQGGGLYRTALQAALAYGHKQVVRILLEAGAQQAEEEESVSESE